MKNFTKTISSAILLAATLVGCGTQPQLNSAVPNQAVNQTQQNQRVRSYYFLGQLNSSSFHPDQNGHQFGYDHLTLNYTTFMPNDEQRLRVSYSVHPSNQHMMISHTKKVGTTEEKTEGVSQTDTKKIQELHSFLRTLTFTSKDENKVNLERVLTVLNKLLGQNPLQAERVQASRINR